LVYPSGNSVGIKDSIGYFHELELECAKARRVIVGKPFESVYLISRETYNPAEIDEETEELRKRARNITEREKLFIEKFSVAFDK